MDGTIFVKKKKIVKVLHIVFIVLFAIIMLFFLCRRLSINYANIYSTYRATGIEYSLLYSILTIGSAILLLFLIISFFIKKNSKKQSVILLCTGVLILMGIGLSTVISFLLVDSNEYLSKSICASEKQYFPIDEYEYKEHSSDCYYYKEVSIGDTYWIGSYSYKDFAAESTLVDLTEEPYESTVFTNYYYLKDEDGSRIKEYERSKKLYDVLSFSDYLSEFHQDNFDVYEYDDNYEIIFANDKEVFYFAASKNKRTQYRLDDIVKLAEKHLHNLQSLTINANNTGNGSE